MFNNTLSTKEYAFCGAVSMYVYYFLSHRDEDLEYLLNALKDDQVRLPHLENIRRSLRHEAVSLARITQTMATYPDVIREIVAIFEKKFDYTGDSSGWEDAIPKLREKIAKVAENDQDEEILEYMLSFNEVCVKTNFFKVPKTSISFRLDPKAVKLEKTYPVTPFGIFLFVGNDFHGFHVRFNDIARGGLRLVLSRDKASFSRNLETAFFENYNLAHTQNRKNKGFLSPLFLSLPLPLPLP
jgi:glutamate dehydrogenase